jgi:eukaryotic-like serine/threonine-protein kinase
MAGCLEEGTVLAFLGGTLAPAVRSTVEAHVADCSACADLVTWAAADQASPTGLSGAVGRPFVGQLQPGARVGRYQVLGALGRGGMGEVYAAYHPELDRRIALKVVQGFDGGSGQRRSRLLREARAIARLSHPNVVAVHDAGTFGDRVFIAMELIDGQTIEQWLHAARRTWQAILEVFLAAGRGLAAAHAAGVVHRDFKPQNVMIGKDGIVRVMDFGLARLAAEDPPEERGREAGENDPTVPIDLITKTGAFIGTPAYMSPEQSRREEIDARSDQFSFCVAMHEALFGTRPSVASAEAGIPMSAKPDPSPRAGVPNWLRQIVLRGAAADRDQRYPSTPALLVALERGRARTRRHVSALLAGIAVLVVTGGSWRIARGNRIACAVPKDRVAAVWTVDDPHDPRRKAIYHGFAASGRATAEASWRRMSKVLDDYLTAWTAMYVETCEATHLRGEQSAEVLDLRMSCLSDNLDQVRALTDAVLSADGTVISQATTASLDLTPMSRCANVALLKSAVPLPRQEQRASEVILLRRALTEAETLRELGHDRQALEKALALKSKVEATGYKPLVGELLQEIGLIQAGLGQQDAERTLEEAFFAAEASHDDLTAAKAATSLIHVVGRPDDSDRWARLATAILDRLGSGHSRTRAWALQNHALILLARGNFEGARAELEQAVALKEEALGKDHPDVAISLTALACALGELDRLQDALVAVDRAIAIDERCCEPNSRFAASLSDKAELLFRLGRIEEARRQFDRALKLVREYPDGAGALAGALDGLGEIELAKGHPRAAIPHLERALRAYGRNALATALAANTRFSLAQALWASGGDRQRARQLATEARETFASGNRLKREREVATWLAGHRGSDR